MLYEIKCSWLLNKQYKMNLLKTESQKPVKGQKHEAQLCHFSTNMAPVPSRFASLSLNCSAFQPRINWLKSRTLVPSWNQKDVHQERTRVGVSYPTSCSALCNTLHWSCVLDHIVSSVWMWFTKVARNRTGANLVEKGHLGIYAHVSI